MMSHKSQMKDRKAMSRMCEMSLNKESVRITSHVLHFLWPFESVRNDVIHTFPLVLLGIKSEKCFASDRSIHFQKATVTNLRFVTV